MGKEELLRILEGVKDSQDDLDELIHDVCSSLAETINEEGPEKQVGFLTEHLGLGMTKVLLTNMRERRNHETKNRSQVLKT